MAKVYVITSGCYSDYHICAVTLDPKKAELLKKFYDKVEYDETAIEEYYADFEYNRISEGYKMYLVQFDKAGKVHCIRDNRSPEGENIYETCNGYYVNVTVWAKDDESAIKIAAERRAKYLAEKEGIS